MLLGNKCFSQTIKTIDSLENSYQTCLDKGVNMLGCSKMFYQQMDIMLNLVYKKLRQKLTPLQAAKLKAEQINWLAKRDRYFNNVPLEPEEKVLTGEDKEMIIIDKKAAFVEERLKILIKQM